MPHKGHRVVVVTPAGRRRYLEVLVPQVEALVAAGIVDEYQLWVNTIEREDIDYMQALADEKGPSWLRLRHLPPGVPFNGSLSIYKFFEECTEAQTVYVRFDDDILLLDSHDSFRDFLDFRIAKPDYFLVHANTLNNAVITHLLQRMGKVSIGIGHAGYECMDLVAWKDPGFACRLHDDLLTKIIEAFHYGAEPLAQFRFDGEWLLHFHERVSINCVAWLGEGFARVTGGGQVGADEEDELSVQIPKRTGVNNAIYGGFVCAHFAFFTQRPALESLTFRNGGVPYLAAYKEVAEELVKKRAGAALTC